MAVVATIEPRAWETVLARIETDLLSGDSQARRPPPARAPARRRPRRRPLQRPGGAPRARGARPRAHRYRFRSERRRDHRRDADRRHVRAHAAAGRGERVPGRRRRPHPAHPRDARSASSSPRPAVGEIPRRASCSTRWTTPTLTPEEFLALDQEFHRSLADASGNQVVAAMMAGLRSAIEGYVDRRPRPDHGLGRDQRAAARRAPRHPARHRVGLCALDPRPHPRPHRGLLPGDIDMVKRQFPNPFELLELMKFKKPS